MTYPPIGDYALIADGESAALVSRGGSVDWGCVRRVDAGSCFARMLDRESGGFWAIAPVGDDVTVSRRYLDGTLVLETTFSGDGGEARLLDCIAVDADDPRSPRRELLRIVEGVSGSLTFRVSLQVRFDYGEVKPWRRARAGGAYALTGGDDGLIVSGDAAWEPDGAHDLAAVVTVREGERVRMALASVPPHELDHDPPRGPSPADIDAHLAQTCQWWREWSSRAEVSDPGVLRSAMVLRALTNPVTGAIAAAPTTSLPESPGGSLNWDYRYSWIRDSAFSVRSMADIGYREEAEGFRRFIERSAAGSAEDLQIMYGIYGERRLGEQELDALEGYRGARPVRVGNQAAGQLQLDVFGELLELAWRWHERGHAPDDDYWAFLADLVDTAARRWREPDSGLWESRGDPRHFVHSKVMCWAALDRGIRIAEATERDAPLEAWREQRDAVRRAVERDGYDAERGVFVQAFGSAALDAALLLLPRVDFVEWDDERMVRTADAIRAELDADGLLLRYRSGDGPREGAFLACSFWLAECFACQGRPDEAREVFDRTVEAGNDLGLFSEEYDTEHDELLGNFPQGLTHLSHIAAAVSILSSDGG